MKKSIFLLFVLLFILPLIISLPVCISPKENCEKINIIINESIKMSDLSYCNKITSENISAFLKYPGLGNPEDGSYTIPQLVQEDYCYRTVIENVKDKKMCESIKNLKIESCEFLKVGEGFSQCKNNVIASYEIFCYQSLAKNTQDSSYCNFMKDTKWSEECYKSVDNPKQYYYTSIIKISVILDMLEFYSYHLAPFILVLSLILLFIFSRLFFKYKGKDHKLRTIVYGSLSLLFICISFFEAWVLSKWFLE